MSVPRSWTRLRIPDASGGGVGSGVGVGSAAAVAAADGAAPEGATVAAADGAAPDGATLAAADGAAPVAAALGAILGAVDGEASWANAPPVDSTATAMAAPSGKRALLIPNTPPEGGVPSARCVVVQ